MGPAVCTLLVLMFTSVGSQAMREAANWLNDKLPQSQEDETDNKHK